MVVPDAELKSNGKVKLSQILHESEYRVCIVRVMYAALFTIIAIQI